jgi:hypothetical protein
MKLKTLFVLLLVAVLGGAGYTAVSAGTNYVETKGLVERVVTEATAKRRAAAHVQGNGAMAGVIRDGILLGAREHGLRLDGERLVVSESRANLVVRVAWDQPLFPYAGLERWKIPMTFEWVFDAR